MKIVIVIFLFFPYFLQAQLVEKTFAERRETLEKRYDKVGEFYQNGLVLVENTQKTLKIRKDGTPRTDTIYDEAKIAEKDFSAKERYSSKTDSLQLFLYDSAQKIVWQGFDYEYINLYEDSLLLFVVKKNNGEYGLLDSHFQEVIPPIYPIISTENGYILATDRYGKTGFFSLTGEQLLPCLYETLDMATSFFIAENPNWLSLKWENKYAVYDLKNKKYVLDWQPTYRIRNYYPQKKEFLIAVLDSVLIKAENKTLYSDDYASGITKAYCNASENQRLYPELWGIMDSLGHILLAPIYSDLEYYSQGNFYIVNNKSGGCILDSAKNCIYTFDISISSWKFLKNGKMGIINPVDSTFIPAKYKIINHLTHTGFFKASYDSLHYGIVKGQGEVAFPFIFEDIIYMLYASDNFGHIQAYTENKIYVFDDFAKLLHVFDRKNTLNRYGIWDNEVVKWRKKQGKWGVTNKKGEDIIPFIYDKITWKLAASYQKGYIGEFEALIFLNNEHKSVKKHFFNPYLTENYSEFVIGSGQETIAHNDAEN